MLKELQDKIEAIENRVTEELDELGEKVRQELVIPACLKHGLEFLSGNGTFAFYRGKSSYHMKEDRMSPALRATLEPLLEILNVPIGRHDHIGFHVCDVIPRKIRAEMRKKAAAEPVVTDLVQGFDYHARRCNDRTGY